MPGSMGRRAGGSATGGATDRRGGAGYSLTARRTHHSRMRCGVEELGLVGLVNHHSASLVGALAKDCNPEASDEIMSILVDSESNWRYAIPEWALKTRTACGGSIAGPPHAARPGDQSSLEQLFQLTVKRSWAAAMADEWVTCQSPRLIARRCRFCAAHTGCARS